jgi:hypothetical protein
MLNVWILAPYFTTGSKNCHSVNCCWTLSLSPPRERHYTQPRWCSKKNGHLTPPTFQNGNTRSLLLTVDCPIQSAGASVVVTHMKLLFCRGRLIIKQRAGPNIDDKTQIYFGTRYKCPTASFALNSDRRKAGRERKLWALTRRFLSHLLGTAHCVRVAHSDEASRVSPDVSSNEYYTSSQTPHISLLVRLPRIGYYV